MSKKGGLHFGDYTDITGGRFSLKSFRPYNMSFEDLRPVASREGGTRAWPDNGGRDSGMLMGLEMDEESVWCFIMWCLVLSYKLA